MRAEVFVSFDRQAEMTADAGELGQADVAELRHAEAEVRKAECDARIVRIELGEEPDRVGVRREQPRDRKRIEVLARRAEPTVGRSRSFGRMKGALTRALLAAA